MTDQETASCRAFVRGLCTDYLEAIIHRGPRGDELTRLMCDWAAEELAARSNNIDHDDLTGPAIPNTLGA